MLDPTIGMANFALGAKLLRHLGRARVRRIR
jgi:hypothetical protein